MSAAGAVHFAALMRALMDGPKSRDQLRAVTGLHHVTIARYVSALHRQRVIRIEDHKRGGNRRWVEFFVSNEEGLPDSPKPPTLSRREIDRQNTARRHERIVHHRIAGGLYEG